MTTRRAAPGAADNSSLNGGTSNDAVCVVVLVESEIRGIETREALAEPSSSTTVHSA
jgi:hypothetical protein